MLSPRAPAPDSATLRPGRLCLPARATSSLPGAAHSDPAVVVRSGRSGSGKSAWPPRTTSPADVSPRLPRAIVGTAIAKLDACRPMPVGPPYTRARVARSGAPTSSSKHARARRPGGRSYLSLCPDLAACPPRRPGSPCRRRRRPRCAIRTPVGLPFPSAGSGRQLRRMREVPTMWRLQASYLGVDRRGRPESSPPTLFRPRTGRQPARRPRPVRGRDERRRPPGFILQFSRSAGRRAAAWLARRRACGGRGPASRHALIDHLIQIPRSAGPGARFPTMVTARAAAGWTNRPSAGTLVIPFHAFLPAAAGQGCGPAGPLPAGPTAASPGRRLV